MGPDAAPSSRSERRRQWDANLARIARLREEMSQLDEDSEKAKREFDRAFARLLRRSPACG
jgi:hypothetical protein